MRLAPQDKVTAATKPKGAVEEEDRSQSLKRSMTLEGAEIRDRSWEAKLGPSWDQGTYIWGKEMAIPKSFEMGPR